MSDKNELTFFQKLSNKYIDSSLLRALIQAVPYAGGSLDTLMSESGQKFKEQRIENLLGHLSKEIEKIGSKQPVPNNSNSEELYDMMLFALEKSTRTRSEEKRKRFAKILANQISSPIDWDVADSIIRIISELSEPHIRLLQLALDVPSCQGAFMGLKVITFSNFKGGPENGIQPTLIPPLFPGMDESILKLLCMELVGMGLLKDEGVGRLGTAAMTYFIATDIAKTLIDTLKDENSDI